VIQIKDFNASVSEQELERRRAGAQKCMEEKGVDCLLLVGFGVSMGSAIRYFTDWVCWDTGVYAMLPKKGKLMLWGSGQEGEPALPPYLYRGIGESTSYPYFPSLSFASHFIPEHITAYVKDNGYKVIGLYRQPLISYVIIDALRECGCEFVNMDDEIDLLQAVKSEEEIAAFEEVARLHDTVYAALGCFVRPGRIEHEIAVDIKKCCLDLCCEELNIMVGSGNPIGKHKPYFMQNRRLEPGDSVDILVEVTAPGGLFGEVSRMWSLGKPSSALEKAFADAMEIQEYLASIAKPGLPARELMVQLHKFQDSHGYEREKRLFAHSQGYDVVMRPCCMLNETLELKENMLLAIHPFMQSDSAFAMVTDNFLITPQGGKMMSNTPRKIYVVE